MNNTVTEYLKQEAFTLIISLNAVMRDTCRQWTGDNLLVNTGSQAVSSAPDGFCPTLAEPLQIYISTPDLIDGGEINRCGGSLVKRALLFISLRAPRLMDVSLCHQIFPA